MKAWVIALFKKIKDWWNKTILGRPSMEQMAEMAPHEIHDLAVRGKLPRSGGHNRASGEILDSGANNTKKFKDIKSYQLGQSSGRFNEALGADKNKQQPEHNGRKCPLGMDHGDSPHFCSAQTCDHPICKNGREERRRKKEEHESTAHREDTDVADVIVALQVLNNAFTAEVVREERASDVFKGRGGEFDGGGASATWEEPTQRAESSESVAEIVNEESREETREEPAEPESTNNEPESNEESATESSDSDSSSSDGSSDSGSDDNT